MKKLIRIIVVALALIVVLFLATYLYLRFMPAKNISGQKADFTLPATALASEYSASTEACDKKYIDRIVEVSGTIAEITTDQDNATVFILRDPDSETGVLCTIDKDFEKEASKYKTGNRITIKGTCTGMLFEVVLHKCIIIE